MAIYHFVCGTQLWDSQKKKKKEREKINCVLHK